MSQETVVPTCLEVRVCGRVQGVFFRASSQQQAERLGLSGYAKNLSNGDVKVVICGDSKNISTMLEWLHHGPRLARVDRLVSQPSDEIVGPGFLIL